MAWSAYYNRQLHIHTQNLSEYKYSLIKVCHLYTHYHALSGERELIIIILTRAQEKAQRIFTIAAGNLPVSQNACSPFAR